MEKLRHGWRHRPRQTSSNRDQHLPNGYVLDLATLSETIPQDFLANHGQQYSSTVDGVTNHKNLHRRS